jgi:hypothetical protein
MDESWRYLPMTLGVRRTQPSLTDSVVRDNTPMSSTGLPPAGVDAPAHNSNARSGGNTCQRLFCAGLAVRESVASDHNCDQTRNFRDSSSKEALDGIKAGVEGTSLSMSCEGSQHEK